MVPHLPQTGRGRVAPAVGQLNLLMVLAAGQQALQPLEMLCPDGLLIGCHRRSEVIARRVDEINPFRHGPSLRARSRIVNPVLSRDVDSMSKRKLGSCPAALGSLTSWNIGCWGAVVARYRACAWGR